MPIGRSWVDLTRGVERDGWLSDAVPSLTGRVTNGGNWLKNRLREVLLKTCSVLFEKIFLLTFGFKRHTDSIAFGGNRV